jgi:uncharacterized protein (TIGR02145 family)
MRYESSTGSQGLCPPGWHIPASAEWDMLLSALNGPGLAGSLMKDMMLPGGFHSEQEGFYYQNDSWAFTISPDAGAMYWTSTPSGSRAIARGLNDLIPSVSKYDALKSNAFSVRCVKD